MPFSTPPQTEKERSALKQAVCKTFPDDEKNPAVVTVEETGSGIAPEDQTQTFDRFYRVE